MRRVGCVCPLTALGHETYSQEAKEKGHLGKDLAWLAELFSYSTFNDPRTTQVICVRGRTVSNWVLTLSRPVDRTEPPRDDPTLP